MIAVRADAGNRHSVDASVLAALGTDGHVVNIARGSVIDEAALIAALRDGVIAGAGLDVFEHEPEVPAELRSMANVALTPHIAGGALEAHAAMQDLVCANVDAFVGGRPVLTAVPGSQAGDGVDHAPDGRRPDVYAYTGAHALEPRMPTIVFVHGAAHDHSVWALQSRYFAHHGRNVLALDLPGHGRSAGTPLPTIEAIAQWLPRVARRRGCPRRRRSSVIRWDRWPSLRARARVHDRVTKVALLGPAVPMPVSDALLAAARADDHVAFEMINSWSHSAGKQLGGNQVPGVWMTGAAMRLMERSGPGVLHADLAACHAYDGGLAAAAAIRCPVLVVLGQRDIMAPTRAAQPLIAALADARVVTLPGTGHAMMAEQPDAVLDALRAFV